MSNNKPNLEAIDALIAASEKASDGGHAYDEAANTRAEIKKLRDAYEKQAEAIKSLREALDEMVDASGDGSEWEMAARERAEQALEQTKEFDDER